MRATEARNINNNKKDLSPEQRKELLGALKARFEKNMNRNKVRIFTFFHPGIFTIIHPPPGLSF